MVITLPDTYGNLLNDEQMRQQNRRSALTNKMLEMDADEYPTVLKDARKQRRLSNKGQKIQNKRGSTLNSYMGEDRNHELGEREYDKKRRGTLDTRQDADYEYNKSRRGVLDTRDDELYNRDKQQYAVDQQRKTETYEYGIKELESRLGKQKMDAFFEAIGTGLQQVRTPEQYMQMIAILENQLQLPPEMVQSLISDVPMDQAEFDEFQKSELMEYQGLMDAMNTRGYSAGSEYERLLERRNNPGISEEDRKDIDARLNALSRSGGSRGGSSKSIGDLTESQMIDIWKATPDPKPPYTEFRKEILSEIDKTNNPSEWVGLENTPQERIPNLYGKYKDMTPDKKDELERYLLSTGEAGEAVIKMLIEYADSQGETIKEVIGDSDKVKPNKQRGALGKAAGSITNMFGGR